MDFEPGPGRVSTRALSLARRYDLLLKNLDAWFHSLRKKHGPQIRCGEGCARCCYGLFDVSLPEALRIVRAFDLLPEAARNAVAGRARSVQMRIAREAHELKEPYFLNRLSEDRIDAVCARVGDVACPFLSSDEICLIYPDRPLACRFEGLPMVDAEEGLFGDWCDRNFRNGLTPELEKDLCLDYFEIQATERAVTAELAQYFGLGRQGDVTLFIPSIIAASETFRKVACLVSEPNGAARGT